MAGRATYHRHRRCPIPILLTFFSAVLVQQLVQTCHGDVGTAVTYDPPFLPTACYGDDTTEFPSNNLFAAAGEGIWDNGAACGRQYLVGCISSQTGGISCVEDTTVQIKIVDFASSSSDNSIPPGTTMLLSGTAFNAIARSTDQASSSSSSSSINIEFTQYVLLLMNFISLRGNKTHRDRRTDRTYFSDEIKITELASYEFFVFAGSDDDDGH